MVLLLFSVMAMAISGAAIAMTTIFGMLIWFVAYAIANWMVFEKAGVPGWKALIPFYNQYVQMSLTWDKNMFWVLIALQLISSYLTRNNGEHLGLIGSFVSLIISISITIISIQNIRYLARSFEKGFAFMIGLFFLEPIFTMILGFGSARYIGNTYKS